MVAPARDTPGMRDRICATPIQNACAQEARSIVSTSNRHWRRSTIRITTPPRIKLTATTIGLNRYVSMISWKRRPAMAAGTNANSTFASRARSASRVTEPFAVFHKGARKCQTTARIAPSWMKISNVARECSGYWNTSDATIRWPVEETGRNSVAPSSRPRRMVLRRSMNRAQPVRLFRRGTQR